MALTMESRMRRMVCSPASNVGAVRRVRHRHSHCVTKRRERSDEEPSTVIDSAAIRVDAGPHVSAQGKGCSTPDRFRVAADRAAYGSGRHACRDMDEEVRAWKARDDPDDREM